MTSGEDKTKQLLEQILAGLYSKQAEGKGEHGKSYLQGQDGQFLGSLTTNKFDKDSLLNVYGPYGSKYSPTSIFNRYSPYGSPYGQFSIANRYSTAPPQLFLNGKLRGLVTKNLRLKDAIDPDKFTFALRNHLSEMLQGNIVGSESQSRVARGHSYIEAHDGAFLGRLSSNHFDAESVFNQFGQYGSKFSPQSIFNTFGTYGSQFSNLSPFNQFSSTPPKLFVEGRNVAFLTKNQFLNPRVDPDELEKWIEDNGL